MRHLCFLLLFSGVVKSFTFQVDGQPTQCDPLPISWTGGQAPFRLIIVMPSLVNINVTIPDANFRDNKGSFTLPTLPVPKNTQLFFGMSDATGATSGGTSNLMTVGDSWSGERCNTTTPTNDFFFSAPRTITQCNDFAFTTYQGAIKPLSIFAFIPGGSDSFVLPFSPPTADSFVWKANISAQTQVTFSVIDSLGRFGGSDKLHLVTPSNDNSCLLNPTGGTPSGGSNHNQRSSSIPIGAIAGLVVGGIVLVAILGALLWWLRRRQSKSYFNRGSPINLTEDFPQNPELPQPMLSRQYAPVPYPSIYISESTNGSTSSFHPEQLQRPPPPPLRVRSYHDEDSTSSLVGPSGSKPGSQTKFVVHRDIDEVEGPIELPPQYDGRRAPILGLVQASSSRHGVQSKIG